MKRLMMGLAFLFVLSNFIFAAEIKVGVIGPLSGDGKFYGETTINGVKLAIDQINAKGGVNGNTIKLIIEDDKGNSDESINAAKKLINVDKVSAIIGPVFSSNCLAVAPLAQQAKIPMLTPTGTNVAVTNAGDFISRICFVDPFQGEVMANFALDNLKVKTAVIMTDIASDYSKGLSDSFEKVFTARGGKVLDKVSYNGKDTDFTAQLTKIKGKKPAVIFAPGYAEVALIVKQARDIRIKSVFLGGDGWDSPDILKVAGSSIDGSFASTHFSPEAKDPAIKKFLEDYKKAYSIDASVLSALGFDAGYVFADALKKAGSADAEKLKAAINSTKGFKGVTGIINLDANRNAVKSAFVIEAKGGKFVFKATVDPKVK